MSTIQMWNVGEIVGPADGMYGQASPPIATPSGQNLADMLGNLERPSAASDVNTADEETSATGNVLTNDMGIRGLSVVAVSGSANNVGVATAGSNGGLFTINADGSYVFDPNGEFALAGEETAVTSITYHAGIGLAAKMATLTVTVSAYTFTVDDDFWDYVILCMNPSGADGSTSFADSSIVGRDLTASGNAQVDTSLGHNTLLLDGSGDYVSMSNDTDMNLLSNATIEAFFKTSNSKTQIIFSKLYSSTGYMLYINSGKLTFAYFKSGGTTETLTCASTVGTGERHVAVVRSGGIIYVYLDGVPDGQKTLTYEPTAASVGFIVGRSHSYTSMDFDGHIAGVRYTLAVRYTGAFTPPTFPFPAAV